MSQEIVISVKNVSKAYTIWRDPVARLKHPLLNLAGELCPPLRKKIDTKLHGLCSEFYALNDISFEVKKGEAVGIIGRNGSGKSTLLQIIAGTLQPSSGSVTVHGRVAALLELGSGFNPEFTGRENVFLNASILGLTREETEERFEKIEAFADIGDFMNRPVKTYSSGMMVRLAFAVQAMVDPDILIIDEALAVGDYFFQQKCAARMRELREAGTTLLFVSHDMASVRDLCQKALYLKKGKPVFWGESENAISCYFNERRHAIVPQEQQEPAVVNTTISHKYIEQLRSQSAWWSDAAKTADGKNGILLGIKVNPFQRKIKMGESIIIRGFFLSCMDQEIHMTVEFKNRYDQIINSTSTYTCTGKSIHAAGGNLIEVELYLDLMIEAGQYSYQVSFSKEGAAPNRGERIDQTPWLGPLEIEWDYEHQKAPFLGMFGLPASVSEIKKQKYR